MKKRALQTFLCVSTLLMMTSCGKTEKKQLSTETEDISKTERENQIETEQSAVVSYADYLTENGSGIAIERPPVDDIKEMFRMEQCSPLDIRWYDCNLLSKDAEIDGNGRIRNVLNNPF